MTWIVSFWLRGGNLVRVEASEEPSYIPPLMFADEASPGKPPVTFSRGLRDSIRIVPVPGSGYVLDEDPVAITWEPKR